ncbi:RPA-related protein RADX isoform X2 [Callorhinchus milii]|nr:RPA-related protein RADX isoform X2 [Callorhinchus milii]XP_042196725.1 RPA-related protein RADX isoform X2 [Callorhinchus milii]XP_042196726.1 RPA-related protein RADX isoform X2 [Callorhinchus milii]XP_042196727.1 RPA-related protein RADX isoform X2 [Callorhinchus milii]
MSAGRCDRPAPGTSAEGVGARHRGDASVLSDLFHQLVTGATCRSVVPDPSEPLVVWAVERYLGETAVRESSGPEPQPSYLYDVTLTDGACQAKAHLAPDLNCLVYRNALRAGSHIRITRCSLVYEEMRLSHCFLQVEALELGGGEDSLSVLRNISNQTRASPYNLTATQRGRDILNTLQLETPLKGGRTHYLPLWNNNDPHGGKWNANRPLAPDVQVNVSGLITLQGLMMTWRNNLDFPRLLVRIMHKSRLRYYGRITTKINCPIQAYFEVADKSGMMPMVLWNSLCPEWYQSLNIGTVLLLHRYAVKPSYQKRTWATPFDPQMKSFRTIEISLNPQHLCTVLQIVPAEQIKPEWELPEVKYNFISRLELEKLPHAYTCDIIGLVTFVGRCERLRKKADSEDFFLYRWVHVVDGSSDQPFILELFSTSQPETFEHIHPMTYLVCTQMRVVRENLSSRTNSPYLTTSNESQIFITGCHKGQPYTWNPQVKHFIQWIKGQREKEMLSKCKVGGYFSFPPVPATFSEYCKNAAAETFLTSTNELKKEIEKLHYREHKRILIQGVIGAVQYVSHSDSTQSLSAEPVQRSEGRPDQGVNLLPPKDRALPGLLSEPAGPKEQIVCSQSTEELEPRPVKKTTNPSCPVLSSYVLRRRYSLRNLKRVNYNLPARRQVRQELPDPKKLESQKKKSKKNRNQKKTPLAIRLKATREHSQEAEVPTDTTRFIEQSEELVADNAGPSDRQETQAAAIDLSRATWKSPTWQEITQHLPEYLNFGQLLPESVPRKFDYKDRDFLMQQYNLQPEVYTPGTTECNRDIQSFSPAYDTGYYSVTIVGVNQQLAVDVMFLPATKSHEDHRVSGLAVDVHDNTLASIMATGYICQPADVNGENQTPPTPGEIVKSANELDGLHFICVLDMCHHSGNRVEVCLNKTYRVSDGNH